jgi:hypothetical protein
MTEAVKKKRDEWIVRFGLLAMAILFGYSFIFGLLYANWKHYWLTVDAKQTMAVVTDELWSGHGVVDYKYTVNQNEYTGRSTRNWEQEKYRNVGVGQESTVFYSFSHPWLSSLETPQFPQSGTIILLIALPIEFLLIITVVNPRSAWALNVLQEPQPKPKT